MSKYSIHATKKDYQYAFDTLLKLEKQLKENLNWKKIKRVNLDELVTLIAILKRKLPAPTQPLHTKGKAEIRISPSSDGDMIYVEADGHICDLGTASPYSEIYPLKERMANAERIVKCLNNESKIDMHDELVKKLRQAHNLLKSRCLDTDREMLELELSELLKQAEQLK